MKKLMCLVLMVVGLSGCASWFGENSTIGNGKIDVPFDIEVIYSHDGVDYHAVLGPDEVALTATDNLGNVYKLGYAPEGGMTIYLSQGDNAFVQAEDGKLVLNLPDGTTVKVKQAE